MAIRLVHILFGAYMSASVFGAVERIWPLVPSLPNAEVKNGGTLIKDACALGQDQGHPSLDYESISFLGSSNSFLDLHMTESIIFDDFSFTLYIGQPLPREATLFHYRRDTSIPAKCINEVKLSINGSHFIVVMTSYNGQLYKTAAAITYCFPTTSADDWLSLGIAYFGAKRIVSFVTSEVTIRTQNVDWPDIKLSIPGTLRLGTSHNQADIPYRGRITCVQMWSKHVYFSDIDGNLQNCRMDEWAHPPSSFTKETNTCAANGRYRILARDSTPVSGEAIVSLTQGSRLLCAAECDRTEGCESFSHVGETCKLFSTLGIWDLDSDPGTSVYIKSYPCC